ncbi:MAG: formate dehydrogenase accessory sulfurtransferase FdhD [Candidatus Methanofastidiosia archaeon]|jgi:FdhD protein
MDLLTTIPVHRFDILKNTVTPTKEWVITEKRYRLLINNTEVTTVVASPSFLKELAVGYVVGRGILHIEDITGVTINQNSIHVTTESHIEPFDTEPTICEPKNVCKTTVPASLFVKAASKLQTDTTLWKKTNAAHSAALCTFSGDILKIIEDVSRHNAFDKVIGWGLLNTCNFSCSFIVLSGRIAQDMVVKAQNVGCFIVASRSTVIEPAVTIGNTLDVTVIGYVREDHIVVFSHPERVTV